MADSKAMIAFWVTAMLILGTATAVCAKTMFQTCAENGDGREINFNKPWMQTMLMFMAMSLAMLVYVVNTKMKEFTDSGNEYAVLDGSTSIQEAKSEQPAWKLYLYIQIPAVFDLFATTLSGVGLLWVDASVYQMLRGSLLIFSAILSVVFLKRKLKTHHYAGIGITLIAITMVGVASVESSKDAAGTNVGLEIIGIVLIICGQAVQASQIVVEEVLLKDYSAPALVIVGMEGIWGVIWMVVLLLILQYTPGFSDSCYDKFEEQCTLDDPPAMPISCSSQALYHEDTDQTIHMMGASTQLAILMGIYLFAILGYNVSGMNVTKNLTAIHRTILEACRTLCIWIVQLFIKYVIKWNDHGEEWNEWSYLQAAGFTILICGTLTYNKIIKLPCINYEESENSQAKKEKNMPKVKDFKASPRQGMSVPWDASPAVSTSSRNIGNDI